jgi:lysophospholipase L1-like esterase
VYLGSTIGFPTNPENIVAGEYYVKFSFPTAEMRTLEFTTHLEFGGLAVNAEATMVTPPASRHRFVVLDGSLSGSEKHQTGNFALTGGSAGTYTAISSMFYMAAMALGFDEGINLATGSSGYAINGDTVSFKTAAKLSELLSHSPSAVFLGGPNNDISAGQSASQLNTNTAFVLNYIRTNFPNVPIFMMGAFTPPVMGSQASAESTVAPYNAVMKANAQTYGAWFVNPTTGETFDPSGTRRMVTSNWVYQNTSNIASDGQHPTQSGANTLGVMFADSIKMAFPEGTIPKGSGSLDYGISASGTGTAPGVAVHHGFGVLSYGLDGSGNGKTAKSGSGSLSFGESVQGSGSTIRRGSGSLGFSESVSGSGKVKRSGSGSLSYTESVIGLGSSPRHGHGELQLSVTAEGSGRAPVTIPATGGGSLSFKMGGNGSGSNPRRGEGSLGFTHVMFGSGETSRLGSGSLSFGLNSSGVGTILKTGGGSLEYVMETSGSGKTTPVSMHRGSGSLSYTEVLSGSGSTARFGEGTLSYSVAIRGSGGNRGAAANYFGDQVVSLAFGDTPVSLT